MESNRRSSVALAMHHGLSVLSTYGLNGHRKGDEHLVYAPVGVWHLYLYLHHRSCSFIRSVCLSICLFLVPYGLQTQILTMALD